MIKKLINAFAILGMVMCTILPASAMEFGTICMYDDGWYMYGHSVGMTESWSKLLIPVENVGKNDVVEPIIIYGSATPDKIASVKVVADSVMKRDVEKADYADWWEFADSFWPYDEPSSSRKWIVVSMKDSKEWSGAYSFRVGLKGTDLYSEELNIVGFEDEPIKPMDAFGLNITGFQWWGEGYWFESRTDPITLSITVPSSGILKIDAPLYYRGEEGVKTLKVGGSVVSDVKYGEDLYPFDDFTCSLKDLTITTIGKGVVTLKVTDDWYFECSNIVFYHDGKQSVNISAWSEGGLIEEGGYGLAGYTRGYVTGGGTFAKGSRVTLTAVPGNGEVFDRWVQVDNYGNEISTVALSEAQLTSPVLSFVVTDSMVGSAKESKKLNFCATWKEKYDAMGITLPIGAGVISGGGSYVPGSAFVLSVKDLNSLSTFKYWKDNPSVTSPIRSIVSEDQDVIYTAVYGSLPRLTINCEDGGRVTGGGIFPAGKSVTLKATANKGYVFAGWFTADGEPVSGASDYRSPSYSYVTTGDDIILVAKFIPIADDVADIYFTMHDEYKLGMAIEPVLINVSGCTSLPTVKVAGLPTGLKFTAKPIYKKGSKTEIEVPANTIYGTPTKSGVYTVDVTATTASKKTSTTSAVIVVRKENEKMVKLSVEEYWNENDEKVVPGKVSGGGIFAEGKKVSLKATANKGFVFAGWYDVANDDWFYGPEDYRNPKFSYVMTDSDVELMAVFMPATDDWVEVWLDMDEEYTTGEEIEDIYVEVDSGSLATLKFKGLPSGLKYTAKAIYDRSGNLLHEANTIYGTPKKSGVYTVTVTATTASKKTSTSSAVIVVRKENEKMVKLAVQDWYDEETDTTVIPGKVSGGGIFAEGKKLSLKATANKGFVFAGWWDVNAGTWLDSAEDYRNLKLSYVMTDSDMDLEAVFIPLSEDNVLDLYIDGYPISANASDNVFDADGEVAVKLEIDSLSLPKASVSGLPKGLKFDAKTNMITGIPTAPGFYTVTVKLTNQSIKKAIEKKFTISVSNLTGANDYFVDNLYNDVGEKYTLSVGISNIDDFLPSLKMNSPTAKLVVSGLPAGLKYDAKTGKITGIATKPGAYTVTLTVTDGREKYVSTITIEVESLPDWMVGTFRGSVDTEGWGWSDICGFEVKVTPQGRVTAKLIEPNPAWESVSLKTYDLIKSSDSEYTFGIWDGDIENWVECSMGEVHILKDDNGLGILYAWEYGIDEDEDEFEAYWEGHQDVYSLSSSVIPMPIFKNDNKYYFNIDEDGGVNLTFGAKGAVTVSEPGVIWGKSQLLPIEYDSYSNVVIASLWLMGYDEWEDCTFGAELILSIPVTQDGMAKASEIIIEDVFPGPNW